MLRDYQQSLYDDAKMAFSQGAHGVCCVLPCRSGKSYVMKAMSESASKKGNVLILAHRHELLKQHKKIIAANNIRIESVFTEVKRLGMSDTPSLIIIDEAHLSEASSYRKVCEFYGCPIVGFTATPARLDSRPLSLFDTLIVGIPAVELIEMGNISYYDYYAPNIVVYTSQIELVAGEYNNRQLTEMMCETAIYGDVLKYYKKLAEGRQAIAYCTGVKHSQKVADMFNSSGISAVSIDGSMSIKLRTKYMDDFKSGEVQILCNCNLVSEGITLPDAEICLMLRPTQSLPLFIQQACRVLTPKDGKKAVIIDFVNNVRQHGLPTDDHEWSLSEGVKKHKVSNDDGTFMVRQCSECFKCFKTASKCPWCGFVYIVKGRELKQVQDVELKKIEAEQKVELEKENKCKRMEVGMCKSYKELLQIEKKRGYKRGWGYMQAKRKGYL